MNKICSFAQVFAGGLMLMVGGWQQGKPDSSHSTPKDLRFVGTWKYLKNEKSDGTPQGVATSELDTLRREIAADGTWKLTGTAKQVSGTWTSVVTSKGVWIEFRAVSAIGWFDERLLLGRDNNQLAGFLPDPSDGTITGYRQFYTRLQKP